MNNNNHTNNTNNTSNTTTMSDNSQTNTNTNTVATNSNNNSSQIISSHYSNSSAIKSTMMKPATNSNNSSTPCSNVSFDDGVDIDLRGLPSFILDLMQIQPTLNIMTCGDVSHGKSTLLKALSGENPGKHFAEKKYNMTIRLGYTSCKIWKCLICPRPQCYFSTHSNTSIKKVICKHCGNRGNSKIILIRHLSFVDVPGHAQLMQTMVSATSVADAAILVIDSSKSVPGNQTAQHLDAINLLGLMKENQMIIAQNKIDLINHSKACLNYEEIRNYLATFGDDKLAFNTPIIPISAQSELNIDALCHSIIHHLPRYSKKLLSLKSCQDLYINIIRSFDVNLRMKSKDKLTFEDIDKMAGGVLGGAVSNGHIEIGQMIEIRPGYIKEKTVRKCKSMIEQKLQPQFEAYPIITTVKSLKYGKTSAIYGYPGGNVGIETNIDPSLSKDDGMCGHIVIDANNLQPPPIFNKFIMSYTFLADIANQQKPFKILEEIRVNIGSFKMVANIIKRDIEQYKGVLCVLQAPICAKIGDKVGICRKNKHKSWSFVGGGIIRKTKNIPIASDKEKLKRLQNIIDDEIDDKPKNGTNKNGKIKNRKVKLQIEHKLIGNDDKEKVHLNYQQRNGRQGVTTIVGLPSKTNFKKLMKKMKKKWNTGATLVEDSEKGIVIQIQGDLRSDIPQYIAGLNIVDKSQITVHGY